MKPADKVRWHRGQAERHRAAGRQPQAAACEASAAEIEATLRSQGRCRECGRLLSDPDSRAKGIGPDCESRLKAAAA